MDNYSLIYEFPDDVRVNCTHIYFDPPGFSGIKERVYGANGRYRRGDGENARGKKTPLNGAESGHRSTL